MTTNKSTNTKPFRFVCYMVFPLILIGILISSCGVNNQSEKPQLWEDEFVISEQELYKVDQELYKPGSKSREEAIKKGLIVTSRVDHQFVVREGILLVKNGKPIFATKSKPEFIGYREMGCEKQKIVLSDADANYVDETTMFAVFRSCIVLDKVFPAPTSIEEGTCLKFIEACKVKNRRIGIRDYAQPSKQTLLFKSDWVIQKLVEQ